jgi:ADP-ribosyl-[dinitrogen reductase] hydrolase
LEFHAHLSLKRHHFFFDLRTRNMALKKQSIRWTVAIACGILLLALTITGVVIAVKRQTAEKDDKKDDEKRDDERPSEDEKIVMKPGVTIHPGALLRPPQTFANVSAAVSSLVPATSVAVQEGAFVAHPDVVCVPVPAVHPTSFTAYASPYCALVDYLQSKSITLPLPASDYPLPPNVDEALFRDRCEGGMLGMLIGDALGSPYEFKNQATVQSMRWLPNRYFLTEFGSRGCDILPGDFTDDASQGLLYAASLVEQRAFDPADIFHRLKAWLDRTYMTSGPLTIGLGSGTSLVLGQMRLNVAATPSNDVKSLLPQYGNGCLMHLTPVPLFFALRSERDCVHASIASVALTHSHKSARDAAGLFAQLVWHFIRRSPSESPKACIVRVLTGGILKQMWTPQELNDMHPKVRRLYDDPVRLSLLKDIRRYTESAHGALNIVVKGLLEGGDRPLDIWKWIIRQGGWDTDTTACIAGGLLGVLFGFSGLRKEPHWLVNQVYAGPVAVQLGTAISALARNPLAPIDYGALSAFQPLDDGSYAVMDTNPKHGLPEPLWYFKPRPDILNAKRAVTHGQRSQYCGLSPSNPPADDFLSD